MKVDGCMAIFVNPDVVGFCVVAKEHSGL